MRLSCPRRALSLKACARLRRILECPASSAMMIDSTPLVGAKLFSDQHLLLASSNRLNLLPIPVLEVISSVLALAYTEAVDALPSSFS